MRARAMKVSAMCHVPGLWDFEMYSFETILLISSLYSGIYQEGDFVANFHGCARDAARNCEEEMRPLMTRWRELRDGNRGR